jgi:esterase/lipase
MIGIKRQYIIEAVVRYRKAYPEGDKRSDEEIWEVMKAIKAEPRYDIIMFHRQVKEGLLPVERLKKGY